MNLQMSHVAAGETWRMPAGTQGDDPRVFAVCGSGRGTGLSVPAGFGCLLIAPHGPMRVKRDALLFELDADRAALLPGDAPLVLQSAASKWLVLVGGPRALAELLGLSHDRSEEPWIPMHAFTPTGGLLEAATDPSAMLKELLRETARVGTDILRIVTRSPGRSRASRRASSERLMRAHQRMMLFPEQSLPLEELCATASYSHWHFVRIFRAAFGEAPHERLTAIRMARARRLVEREELSIAEVGQKLGFCAPSSFSRQFKITHGFTATDLRRARRTPAPPTGTSDQ